MTGTRDGLCAERVRELSNRYAFHLVRWARGRTPAWAKDAFDSRDVVNDTLIDVAQMGDGYPFAHEGVLGRIRLTLRDRILETVRSARDNASPLVDRTEHASGEPALRHEALGAELLERYEAGLRRLPPTERDAVICRAELGLPWTDVTEILDKPGVAAARMAVSRALVHLAREMSNAR